MNEDSPRLSWTDFVYELSALLRKRAVNTPLYLVGGTVRDAYLRRAITDVDIAVDGDAVYLARQVADWLDADVFVMDVERGVARVLHRRGGERVSIDFARLRGTTLEQDLRDRDFTMNAMAADLLGNIDQLIDPLGGAADLQQKVLRRCSDEAIGKDPIRALRAVRLSAQFHMKIHPDTVPDIREHAANLNRCSGERIRDEFFKLLGLDQAARGLRVLQHLGLLQHIAPGSMDMPAGDLRRATMDAEWTYPLATVERMAALLKSISSRRTDNTAAAFDLGTLVIQLDRFRPELQAHIEQKYGGARSRAELLVLAALLLGRDDVDVRALKLSGDEEYILIRAVANVRLFLSGKCWSVLDQHRFWHRLKSSGIDVILLGAAEYLAAGGNELRQHDWLELVENATQLLTVYFQRYDDIVDPPLLLNGHDIQERLQLRPGPLVGELLTALREAQVAGAIRSKPDAKEFLRQQIERRSR
ncbi:MAG: hypothetical protein OXG78_12380 [Chloroflexi bacterium]|nr:hypothetical protein [Chloroflexota bacterium]